MPLVSEEDKLKELKEMQSTGVQISKGLGTKWNFDLFYKGKEGHIEPL